MNKVLRLLIPFIVACLMLGMLIWLAGVSIRVAAATSRSIHEGAILVTTLEDERNNDGDCSLREAITAANDNIAVDACATGDAVITDTITFGMEGTITVTSQLTVTAGGPLVINGGDVITTSGGGTTRVWWVETGSVLTIQNLSITDGSIEGSGAGLYNNAASVTIVQSQFIGNRLLGDGYFGGAIYSLEGTLVVNDSLFNGNGLEYITGRVYGGGIAFQGGMGDIIRSVFHNNTALGECDWFFVPGGGGIYVSSASLNIQESSFSNNQDLCNGGGIAIESGEVILANSTMSGNYSGMGGAICNASGTVSVINSTLSNNSASSPQVNGSGGAIYNYGTVTVTNSTLSGNSADITGGGAMANFGTLTVFNTIVANSPSGGDCSGSIIDGGYNISSDDTCGFDPANDSIPNTDPLLGPLQDNGSPSLTHALLWGSPAIDAGDDSKCPPTDQRGVARPKDGDGDGISECDIGSYEAVFLVVNTLDDELISDGDCSLREAIEAANTNLPVDACGSGDVLTDTITFDVAGTITVTSQLSVTAGGPLVIDGGEVITTSGGGTTRVWWVETGSVLNLQHLAVVDGYVHNENGAGLFNNGGDLTILECDFIGNHFTIYMNYEYGGGIYAVGGTLNISDSYFGTNGSDSDSSFGGGIAMQGVTGVISRSTFFNNTSHGCWDFDDACDDSGGGGIYLYDSSLIIQDTSIISNTSGGGIANYSNSLTINNSTLTGNANVTGGAILNAGTLIVTNSTLVNNYITGGWETGGGAITNFGTLTVTNTTLSGNSGVSMFGGAVDNHGWATITNTTLSGNYAPIGGAINNSGTLIANNSTLFGNHASYNGGAINNGGTLTANNTIVANSPSGGDCSGLINDGGHNISSDDTCGFDPANGSMPNTDPLLGSLQDNGGPTWTHALLPGSPAIDTGDDAHCPLFDQRGVSRPKDGDGDGNPICDIGSYEFKSKHLVVTTLEDELNNDGDCSLREAIEAANTNVPVDTCGMGDAIFSDSITFAVSGTIHIINTLSVIAGGPLEIDGGGVITTSGGEMTRIWWVGSGSDLILQNLSIIDGTAMPVGLGGGVVNDSDNLLLINCKLSGNSAYVGGGIYNTYQGILTIDNSTILNNSAWYGGGISNIGTLFIADSTFLNNNAYDWGGGIDNGGTISITNNTFSGNTAGYSGGGINNQGNLFISNSTISGNSAVVGGGVNGIGILTNTIIANSPSGGDCSGPITDQGHNLDSDDTCGLNPANGSMPNTDPLLGPLQDNGGPTWTHALLPNSPAIDTGDDAQCPPTDQRNVPRPQDGNGDGESICDIGSYELEGLWISPTLVTITGPGNGFVAQSYSFTATVEPISTTLPLTYVWEADGQAPITYTSGLTDTNSFIWDLPGTQIITVTASNLGSSVTDTHVIMISPPIYNTYLPLVIKSSSGILTHTQPSSLLGGGEWMGLVIVGIIGIWKRRG